MRTTFLLHLCIFYCVWAGCWHKKCSLKKGVRRSQCEYKLEASRISRLLCCSLEQRGCPLDLSLAAYRWQWEVSLSSSSFLQVWWKWQTIQEHAVFGMKPTQQQCYTHFSPYQSWQDFYMGILWRKASYPITPSPSHSFLGEYLSTIVKKNFKKTCDILLWPNISSLHCSCY